MQHVKLTDQELQTRIEHTLNHRLNLKGTVYEQTPLTFAACHASAKTVDLMCQITPWMSNISGQLHGGVMATIFDSSMGILCIALTQSRMTPTVSLQISYIRPVELGTTLCIRAKATSVGRHVIHLVAEAWPDGQPDKIAATATATFFRIQPDAVT